MELEAKFGKTLGQSLAHCFRIGLPLKGHDKVIDVSHEVHFSSRATLPPLSDHRSST